MIEQFSRTVLHLYGAAQECRLDEFYEEALRLTKQSLHFDSGVVIKASVSTTGFQIHAMHNHRQPLEKLHDREHLQGPDPTLMKAILQPGRCLSDQLTDLDPRRYHDIIAYAKKYDVAHSLVLVAPDGDSGRANVISLWRARQSKRYGAVGQRVGDLLLPHLILAARINQQRLIGALPHAEEDGALLIADASGCLRFVDEYAVTYLQREWPAWSPPMLPAALLACLKGKSRAEWAGVRIRARLEASRGSVYLRVKERIVGVSLTPAESEVASLAAKGHSYKRIAALLGIAPSTVRNHLHHVYAKLGVEGKAALASRLGRGPGLLGG